MATTTKRGESYRIRASCGYDAKGKQVTRSMTWKPEQGMTAKQIEKELKRQAVLFEEKCSGEGWGGNVKFEAFFKQWLEEYAEKQLRIRTVARLRQMEARIYAALGHLRLDKLTIRHVQSFINNLGEDGMNQNTGGKLSPKTIRNYLSFVSSVCSYAVRMGMIQSNPCERVRLPSMTKKEKECYTVEEAQRFLESLQSVPEKYHAFFVLAIYGGFRNGELLGLEWSDLDFDSCIVTISRTSLHTKEKGTFTDTTKTQSSQRVLKLPEAVFAVLRSFRRVQSMERLQLGDQWKDSNRLFVDALGAPMHPNTPYHWLMKHCKATEQRFLGVHMFRHLNATLLIHSGIDARTVAASLGHSQVSTTLNIYAHTFAEAQARAGEAVANALALGGNKAASGTA